MKAISVQANTPSTLQINPSNRAPQRLGRAPGHRFPLRAALVSSLLITVFSLATPSTADARDSSARKIGRGAANLTLGVLALPGEIVQTTRERGPFVGATWGFIKGTGMFVAHEVVGLWEILTCPFETPPGFKPILTPEFPWGYFYEGQRSGRSNSKVSQRTHR